MDSVSCWLPACIGSFVLFVASFVRVVFFLFCEAKLFSLGNMGAYLNQCC